MIPNNMAPTSAAGLKTSASLRAGSMGVARRGHTATVLANGRVLIVGGLDAYGPFTVAEVFDPAQKTFSVTGNLVNACFGHTTPLFTNGRVLITGGQDASGPLTSAEMFDPADPNGFRPAIRFTLLC